MYNEEKIYVLLDELMASKKVVETSKGPMWFTFPYVKDRMFARHIFDSVKERLESDGVFNMEQTKKEHVELELWSEEQDEALKLLPEYLEQAEERIKTEKNLVRKNKLQKLKRTILRQIAEVQNAFNQMMATSSEFLAYRESVGYMVWRCFRDINEQPLWERYQDILQESDIDFIEELIGIYGTNEEVQDVTSLRKLARDAQWRVRWKAANDTESLFGRGAKDLSMAQFMLVYWTQIYDGVFEGYERPPMEVIEDDDALDKWMERRSEEMERDIRQKFAGSSPNKLRNSKIDDAPEVFRLVDGYYNSDGVFVPYTDEERWERIEGTRSLNADSTRLAQRRTEERLRQTPNQFHLEERIKDKVLIEATGGTIIQKKE